MQDMSLKGTSKGKPKRQPKVPNKLMDNGFVPQCKMSASKLSYIYMAMQCLHVCFSYQDVYLKFSFTGIAKCSVCMFSLYVYLHFYS